jgi:hypothetical protein
MYMHSDQGLIDLTTPVCTVWQDIPASGVLWHLYAWDDNGSGVLDSCDIIAMEDTDTGECWWYHVEGVPVTLVVEMFPGAGEDYLECIDTVEPDSLIVDPVCTWWHKIYPWFCEVVHLIDWVDNNGSGHVDSCDCVWFSDNPEQGWHVVDVGTDLLVSALGPSATESSTWGRLKALYR